VEEFVDAVLWCGEGRDGASPKILRDDVRERHDIGHDAVRRGADAIPAVLALQRRREVLAAGGVQPPVLRHAQFGEAGGLGAQIPLVGGVRGDLQGEHRRGATAQGPAADFACGTARSTVVSLFE